MPDHRHGPGDKQPAQIGIALFGDAPEPLLAAGRVLPRHKPDPGGQFAAILEHLGIGDGSRQCAGDDRPDAGDALQAPADLVGSVPGMDTFPAAAISLSSDRNCRTRLSRQASRQRRQPVIVRHRRSPREAP